MSIALLLAILLAAPSPEANEVIKRAQALFDGIASGDVALWGEAMTEDAVNIDEFGRRLTRAEMLRDLHPLPAGLSGTIEVRRPNVIFRGDTAILDCEMYEQEKVFDQQLVVRYLAALVFLREKNVWKLASMMTVTLPTQPPRLEVKDLVPADYIGTYRYGPARGMIVTAEGGELVFRSRPEGKPTVLEPIGKDVFMDAGEERNLILFRRDAAGRVTSLLERRKFNDLSMKRVD